MRLLRQLAGISFSVTVATVAVLAIALAARALLPTLPLATPAVEATVPAAGASNVLPLNPLTLRFNQPMNRASVERALRLDPPLPGVLIWRDEGRTLVFSPTQALAANTTYRLTLDDEAHSWLFQQLPSYELAFRTTPAPTVTSLLPPDGATDVGRDALLSVGFSRPMVPSELVGRELTLPELLIEPPVAHGTTWLNQSTLLVRPSERLLPGTTYTITVAPELRDLTRSSLGQAVRWRIRTVAPAVADVAPRDGQRDVGLRQPIVISLTEALDQAAVADALRLTPAISGSLAVAPLAPELGAAQIITFTPENDWPASTTIQVVLPGGVQPAQGQLGLSEEARWSFRTADQPRVIGRFPGEGQQLPVGQDVRLVFNTRFDAQTLSEAIVLDPPVEQLSLQGQGGEFRVVAPLRPSTAYTVTLPATLTDTNGVALGRDYVLRFTTAPPPPWLALPEVVGHFLTLSPEQEQVVQLEQVNISAGEMIIYALDQATLVRTLGFNERDWREFQPERYQLRELRRAPLPPVEQRDVAQRSVVPLNLNAEQPRLDPGAYYLRITSVDGPSLNLVASIAPVALALKYNAAEVVVWATDAISGLPVADVSLTLYQAGTVVASGQSDANGLWRIARPSASDGAAYHVVAGDVLGVVSSDWRVAGGVAAQHARQQPARYQGLLWSDRRIYQPGDEVTLSAVVRQFADRSFRWPEAGARLNISVRPSGELPIFNQELVLRPGVAATTLRLPLDTPVGTYQVQGVLNGTRLTANFEVRLTNDAPLSVAIEAPQQLIAGAATNVQVRVRSREGLHIAGADVRWQLRCGTDASAASPLGGCSPLEGTGLTDEEGVLTLPLVLPVEAQGIYQLGVAVEELPGVTGVTTTTLAVVAPLQLELSAPSLLRAGDALDITALVSDSVGQSVANQLVALSLLRQELDDVEAQEVLRQDVVSDEGGVVRANVAALEPGRYTLVATALNAPPRERALYVYAPGFTAWPLESNGALLVADRDRYRAGDVATVLPLLPAEQASALVVRERANMLEPEVRVVQAGEPFTFTIAATDTASLFVSVLAPLPQTSVFAGYIELPIVVDQPLQVRLEGSQEVYQPGASAVLTVTTRDQAGQSIPADGALIVAEQATGLDSNAVARLTTARQVPGVTTASSLGRAPGVRPATRTTTGEATRQDDEPLAALVATGATEPAAFSQVRTLRAGAGQAVLTFTLPPTATFLQANAFVFADAARWGQATTQLVVDEVIRVEPLFPAVLSVGDETQLAVRLTNRSAVAQTVTATLSTAAIVPRNGSAANQQVTIGPGESTELSWFGSAGASSEAVVQLDIQLANGLLQQRQERIPIRLSAPQRVMQGGGLAAPLFETKLSAASLDDALAVLVAPTTQAALLEQWQQLNAAQPRDALLDAETLRAGAALVQAALLPTDVLTPSIERLVNAQRSDGGWSWWPSGETNVFVSAQVALALGAVDQARVTPRVRANAVDFLQQALSDTEELNQQALLGYALAQLGQPDRATAQALAQSLPQLNSNGLAALALSLPKDEPDAARVALALRERAQRHGEGVSWPAASDGFQPMSATGVSARALYALAHIDPSDPTLPLARTTLLTRYGDGSWSESGATAEVISALAAPLPASPENYRYVVTLNGVEVLARAVTTVLTDVQQVMINADDIQTDGDLRMVVAGGGQPLLRYQVRSSTVNTAPNAPLALERRYLDPRTGALLDPMRLTIGQLVEVQLIVVVPREVQFITIADPLPGGNVAVELQDGLSPFEHSAVVSNTLFASASRLVPGIYEWQHLIRTTVQGTFAVPAPQTVLRYDRTLTGSGVATRVRIQ